jgi:hypothetical protein
VRLAVAAALVGLLATSVACTSGKDSRVLPSPSNTMAGSPTPSASPTSTIDPQAQPAVDAYLKFNAAANNAEREPRQLGEEVDPKADYTKYTFDPFEAEYGAYILWLADGGLSFKGTPPKPRLKVSAINLTAKPYPTVILENCPTPATNWMAYDRSGKPAPEPTESAAPEPYKATIQMIKYDGRWGVYKITPDTGETCTP